MLDGRTVRSRSKVRTMKNISNKVEGELKCPIYIYIGGVGAEKRKIKQPTAMSFNVKVQINLSSHAVAMFSCMYVRARISTCCIYIIIIVIIIMNIRLNLSIDRTR
jgi:hypothetical protein